MLSIKEKRNIRRRSNWYIYLISFAVSFVALAMFVAAFWDNFFPQGAQQAANRQGVMNFVPTEEMDITILFMLGESQGGVPAQYMMMNYRPRDEIIHFVPLRAETKVTSGSTNGTLTQMYRNNGAKGVMSGINSTFGLEIEYYIKFDRSSFINFINSAGEVLVHIPFDLNNGNVSFRSGENLLSGTDLYNYITFNNFEVDDYNLVVMGSVGSSVVNNNFNNLSSEEIQNHFNKILNNADTNLTFRDYTFYQQALIYTSENSWNPATFFIPIGEFNGSGEYEISARGIVDILTKFGLN